MDDKIKAWIEEFEDYLTKKFKQLEKRINRVT